MGRTVVPVDGSYDDAFASRFLYKRFGGINAIRYNPMMWRARKATRSVSPARKETSEVIYAGRGRVHYAGVCKGVLDLRDAASSARYPRLSASSRLHRTRSARLGNGRFEMSRQTTGRFVCVVRRRTADGGAILR